MSRRRVRIAWGVLLFAVSISTPITAAADEPDDAVRPESTIQLFNGRDLDGFYTYLTDTGRDDPRGVFSVRDGLLHVSGDGLGYLATERPYRDYHLVVEYKWGDKTWAGRRERAKDSGILVHGAGPDGANGPWMASIESQVIEGGCGDFIVIPDTRPVDDPIAVSLTCEIVRDRDGEAVWRRGGEPTTFTAGRINWFGRDVDWEDRLGFRGREDVESPDGEWTVHEVICDGDRITNIINGVVVNEGCAGDPSAGRILFQTELAEILFRRIELRPLDKADDEK